MECGTTNFAFWIIMIDKLLRNLIESPLQKSAPAKPTMHAYFNQSCFAAGVRQSTQSVPLHAYFMHKAGTHAIILVVRSWKEPVTFLELQLETEDESRILALMVHDRPKHACQIDATSRLDDQPRHNQIMTMLDAWGLDVTLSCNGISQILPSLFSRQLPLSLSSLGPRSNMPSRPCIVHVTILQPIAILR